MQRGAPGHALRRLAELFAAAKRLFAGRGTPLHASAVDGTLEVRARRRRKRREDGRRGCGRNRGSAHSVWTTEGADAMEAMGAAARRPAGVPIGSARSLPAFGASQRSRSSKTVKTAGTITSVSSVEV